MSDLVNGFKELVLNRLRRYSFMLDIKKYARLSTEVSKEASIKFLNFNVYNILMYNIVFGIVVFVFPLFITNINVNELRENLFIVFYMITPFVAIAGAVPQITSMMVNLNRINALIKDLDKVSATSENNRENSMLSETKDFHIKLLGVEYTYRIRDNEGEKAGDFSLGPINLEIRTGEIIFITGGNGSGKSTLAKLITGLYSPDKGDITINGRPAELLNLNECFASVFSDFHLFKKLYGINYKDNKDGLEELLKKMEIKDKIDINDEGEFSSLNLSIGQKKRLAFVVCCLESKPMLLFDEWAAEQDPGFRKYFYNDLLPMLKRNGKGVVVVTHDDRYFNVADRLIELERGMLVKDVEMAYA
jgi:putative ATP-binding cassette transporter